MTPNSPRSSDRKPWQTPRPRGIERWQPLKLLLPNLMLGLLTACMASPPTYESEQPPPSASGSDAAATYEQPSPSASTASQFTFPMTSCGDQTSEPSETWYSVFVDGASVEDIRSRYCGDAVSATRPKSGNPTVQAASFTSYAKALALAKAIGGVVEQSASPAPGSDSASTNSGSANSGSANSGSAASPSASANSAAPSSPAPGPAPAAQVGQAAYLNSSESGSPINIRTSASTSADVQSTGYAGDSVQIASSAQGDDGFTWYEVRLDSGTQGWVRGDLVSTQPPARSAQAPAYNSADQGSAQEIPDPAPSNGGADPAPYDQPYGQPPYAQAPEPPYGQPPYAPAPHAQSPYGQPSYGQSPHAQSPYSQPPYGQPSYGQPGRGRPTTLTAREPGASINIREGASMNARVRYRANPGDPIQVSGSAQGDDGFTWYQVRFSSGAVGWVRGDLVVTN